MEQLSQYNKNLAVATSTTGRDLLTSEESKLQLAIQNERINRLGEEEFALMLLYIYTLIGLRGENYPSGIEKDFIHTYIRENYGGHTVAEVRLAFTMAIQNKLSVDATAFEFFTTSYFSRIMEAYRKWAKEAINVLPKKLPEQSFIPPTDEEFIKSCLCIYRTTLDFTKIPVLAYKVLEPELNLTREEKTRIKAKVIELKGNKMEFEKGVDLCKQYAVKEFFDNQINSDDSNTTNQ